MPTLVFVVGLPIHESVRGSNGAAMVRVRGPSAVARDHRDHVAVARRHIAAAANFR